MKRAHILAGLVFGFSLLRLTALGQDATTTTTTNDTSATSANATNAAAVAEQQGVEERFKQLSADIENLRAAQQALLDKLSALRDDIQQIRTEQARLAANSTVQDDLKVLAQKIEEVDKKRQDDKETISEEIKTSSARLEKLLAESVAPPPKTAVKPPSTADESAPANSVFYTVKPGNTLGEIVNVYNDDFKSKGQKTITRREVMDANKDVDWEKLQIGQKIIIPLPPE